MADDSFPFERVASLLSGTPRASVPHEEETVPAAQPVEARWRSDLRLFAITFTGGFVFFLTYLG
jgi:hypothetical protein